MGAIVFAIEIKGLSYSYPDGSKALDRVGLSVGIGETVALVGPNGSGKTTLLLHLNGILKPVEGSVKIFGEDVHENLAEIRRKVGIVFQNPDDQLFSPTVFEDVAFGPLNIGLRGDEVNARVAKALLDVELEGFDQRSSHHLSFGEKKRASIATVLSMEPELLALDEPTMGMDPWIKKDFLKLLGKLKNRYSLLIATHDTDTVKLCDRTVMLKSGRLADEQEFLQIP